MQKLRLLVAALVATSAISALTASARTSPHDTISLNADGNRVTIVYGRPYTKAPKTGEVRKIWGGLVPFGKVWRAGADEATLLMTQHAIVLGGATIPAGAYTLYVLPAEDGSAKLIVNKQVGQWGTEYDAGQDLVRLDLKKEALSTPVDQFTITLTKAASGGGVLTLQWENTQYSAAYSVQK